MSHNFPRPLRSAWSAGGLVTPLLQHEARIPARERALELPTTHRVPVTWLRQHACAAIRWRTVQNILPPGSATPVDLDLLRDELLQSKAVVQALKKQKSDGTWGGNMLGLAPAKSHGIKDVGTVHQYRHLVELGVPRDERAFMLADRVLFRVLSRDEDPKLLFEYQKAARSNPGLAEWARELLREAATAALAHAGHIEDPRVRGAAHRVLTKVSHFLRSEAAEKPIIRKGSRNLLNPEAYPPSIFSVATLAYMTSVQRERAGLLERLGTYLGEPETKRSYVILIGRKVLQPAFHLLGDPLQADSSGNPKDLPLALHWIELLARLGMLGISSTAQRILARLLKECDDQGVWSPRNLRAIPKGKSKLADFAFPLETDTKDTEKRKADVTFRLALIAKFAGWELEFV